MNENRRGQASVETLFAVIIVLGMMLVAAVIGAQQNQNAQLLKTAEEKATLCRTLADTIETVNANEAQTNVRVLVSQPVWIAATTINFSPNGGDFFCDFSASVQDATNTQPKNLAIGYYTVSNNTVGQVVFADYCAPHHCKESEQYQCGTLEDACGGEIYCGACSGTQTCQNGRCVDNSGPPNGGTPGGSTPG